jgi:hypothetical protein
MKMKRFFFVAIVLVTLGFVKTSHAGSITFNIDNEFRDIRLEEGRYIRYCSGPLLYGGVQIGTGTALLYYVSPTPEQPDPDIRVFYDVIEVKVGEFSGFLATTAVPDEAQTNKPTVLIDKATGAKLLGGTLRWSYGGGIIGMEFTFSWPD